MIKFQVITKISPTTLYDAYLEFHKKGKHDSSDYYKASKVFNIKKEHIHVKLPVFYLGEIIVIDDTCGREIGGMCRKADKWFVEYKEFSDINKAVKLASKISGQEVE